MKKIGFLVFLLVISSGLFAQAVDEKSGDAGKLLQQYQTFSWKKIAKARNYEITIEEEKSENVWVPSVSKQTTDNNIELLLYPGHYRVAISVFNALGKKTSTTEWTNFIILNETQPYLYADSLNTSLAWESPLLTLRPEGSTTVEEVDDEGTVTSREGDPLNSFFLKGKNIFFQETSFSLVPKANTEKGRQFQALVDKRKEIPLEIYRRDTENSGVVVIYDSTQLFSGYYDIVVRNPGGQEAKLELLVFYNGMPEFDTSIYGYNDYYKVNTLDVSTAGEVYFPVRGSGFGNNTTFKLEPSEGYIPYPFASKYQRSKVDMKIASHQCLDDQGNLDLSFSIPDDSIYTGYYKLTASNGGNSETSILLLIQANGMKENAPEVKKIQAKPDKSSNEITYQINGTKLDENTKISLISTYSEETDSNKRYEVSYLKSKRNGQLHILTGDGEGIEPGIYAILMENKSSSEIVYVEVNEKQNFKLTDVSQADMVSLFFRPAEMVSRTEILMEEKFEEVPTVWRTKQTFKTILPALHVAGAMNTSFKQNNIDAQLTVDLLNLQWFRLDAGLNVFMFKNYGSEGFSYGGDCYFEIPLNYVQPYIGVGYYGIGKVTKKGATYERGPYMPVSVGLRFLTVLEMQYTLNFENIGTDKCFAQDRYSIGISIPLHGLNYSRVVYEYEADISSNDPVGGDGYLLNKKTTELNINAATITGFPENKTLKKLNFGEAVETICEGAFADCTGLKEVTFMTGLKTIEQQAFANDTGIEGITIPSSITTIEKDAFAGWTNNQSIILDWSSDYEEEKNLEGLEDLECMVLYRDYIPYTAQGSIQNSFYNAKNWKLAENSRDSFMAPEMVFKDGNRYSGMTISTYSSDYKQSRYDASSEIIDVMNEKIKNTDNKTARGMKITLKDAYNQGTGFIVQMKWENSLTQNYNIKINEETIITFPPEAATNQLESVSMLITPGSMEGVNDWAFTYRLQLYNVEFIY